MKINDLISKYNQINTPEELLSFMSKYIEYGYLGKNNKIYYASNKDFDKDWYSQYILQSKDDILKTAVGNCLDQTELERSWFLEHNYEVKTFLMIVSVEYENCYPMHSYLAYKNKDDDTWNYFENADSNNRGIHKFNNLSDLVEYQLNNYINFLKTFHITEEEIAKIIIKEYKKPKERISADEYIDFVTNA